MIDKCKLCPQPVAEDGLCARHAAELVHTLGPLDDGVYVDVYKDGQIDVYTSEELL